MSFSAVAGRAAMVAVLAMALAGCGHNRNQLQGPVALGIGQDGLQIAICTSIEASSFVLEARIDGEWTNAWVAQGGASIESGTVITPNSVGDVFPDFDIRQQDFEGYSDLTVRISSVAGGENVVAAFEPALLQEESWLHPDDSISDDPCVPDVGEPAG